MQPNIDNELAFFKNYQTLYNLRFENMNTIQAELQKKYPNITQFYMDDCSYTITTQYHVLRRSQHAAIKTFKDVPTFVCKDKISPMDMTPEKFNKMREDIKNDYQQCLSAIYYIQFRHEIRD